VKTKIKKRFLILGYLVLMEDRETRFFL
jgi:hypothetical protein